MAICKTADLRRVTRRFSRVGRVVGDPGAPYLYLLPAGLALAVFVWWPLIRTLELSVLEWNLVSPARRFVGLGNFASLATDPVFWISVVNTGKAAVALIAATVTAPLALAIAVLRIRGWPRVAYRTILFSPTVISTAVASVIWLWIYNPLGGLLARTLRLIGRDGGSWLTDPRLAIWAITLTTAWKTFGYNFVLFEAGLLSIPAEILEAAHMDGAGGWGLFRHVVWPLLGPTTLFVILTTCLVTPQALLIPTQILTEGGPNEHSNNLSFLIWQQGFELFRAGRASSIAVLMFLAFLGVAVAQFRILEGGIHYGE